MIFYIRKFKFKSMRDSKNNEKCILQRSSPVKLF